MQSKREKRKRTYAAKVEAGARPYQYSSQYVDWRAAAVRGGGNVHALASAHTARFMGRQYA